MLKINSLPLTTHYHYSLETDILRMVTYRERDLESVTFQWTARDDKGADEELVPWII